MKTREILDGIISSYYYRKYFGTGKYIFYFLKNLKNLDTKYFLSLVKKYSAAFGHKYTFFLKGDFIRKFPLLVLDLHYMGHEIAYHSYYHISSLSMSLAAFEKDMELGKGEFDKLNIPLRGYRAPHLLFDEKHYSILKQFGLLYSSSKYFRKTPYQITDGLYEVPITFLDIFDYDETYPVGDIRSQFYVNSIHLYHPYGLLARRHSEDLFNLFSSIEIPVVTISELLKGQRGMCITIDIGV